MDEWGAAALLVPGDPGSVADFASRLLTLAGGLADAATRIGLVGSNTWTGQAATAFSGMRDVHAGAFWAAAEAFAAAGLANRGYATVLANAQGAAGSAIHLHARAEQATDRWLTLRTAARAQAKGPRPPAGQPEPTRRS